MDGLERIAAHRRVGVRVGHDLREHHVSLVSAPLLPRSSNVLAFRNYDTWGASSSPGPNAPLGNLCGNSTLPQYSAQAGLAQWTAAGFPASKLLLGLPLYGYVSQSSKTVLHEIALPQPGFDVHAYKQQVLGLPDRGLACPVPPTPEEVAQAREDAEKGEGPKAMRGAHPHAKPVKSAKEGAVSAEAAAGDLSAYYGQQIPFNQLVALGALKKNSDGTYTAANGYTMGASRSQLLAYVCATADGISLCGQLGTTAATRRSCTTRRARWW